jgi:hypothetical protein
MRWSIDFPIPASPFPISHSSKVVSLGSCFAQTIGKKMHAAKFEVLVNPFGTLFHPLNLADLLQQAIPAAPMNPAGVVEREGVFVHYKAHSDVKGATPTELEDLQPADAMPASIPEKGLPPGTHLGYSLALQPSGFWASGQLSQTTRSPF